MIDAKDRLDISTQLPAAEGTADYPHVHPYAAEAETAPLLFKVRRGSKRGLRVLSQLSHHIGGFFNPPMIGGLAAIFTGMIPLLRTAFFDERGLLQP